MKKLILFVCFSLALATLVRADTPGFPTMDELKQMYTEKQYSPLLQKLAAVLQLQGPAGAKYDRYQLFMLRGETHVQLKRIDPAVQAFNDAGKVAQESQHLSDMATARAMAETVKKSNGMVYKHANSADKAHPDTFDLTDADPDKRKAAFAAVFDDEMTVAQPKAKAAMANKTSVGPIIAFAKGAGPLRLLEFAATGDTKKCDEVLGALAAHAQDVIEQTIKQMDSRTDQISFDAHRIVTTQQPAAVKGGVPTTVRKYQGLTTAEVNELRSTLQTCSTIPDGDKLLSEALGDPDSKFANIGTTATKLQEKARNVLDMDYSAVLSQETTDR